MEVRSFPLNNIIRVRRKTDGNTACLVGWSAVSSSWGSTKAISVTKCSLRELALPKAGFAKPDLDD